MANYRFNPAAGVSAAIRPVVVPFAGVVEASTAVARAVRRAIAAADRWGRAKDTVAVLSGLDDHVLRDIGIHRSEIGAVARSMTDEREWSRAGTDR